MHPGQSHMPGTRGPSRRAVVAGATTLVAAFGLSGQAPRVTHLRLGHGLPRTHPVHRAMLNMADLVSTRSKGDVTISVFGDGLLGEEPALLEQVKLGSLDMTKASASVLESVNPLFRLFDLPFLFRDKAHWSRSLSGEAGQRVLAGQPDAPVRALCFYDAGARNFYGQKPIRHPSDLAGQRIRVQPSPSTLRLVQLLDAVPVPLPWGVVYAALQSGLVDGAENNVTALTFGRHAEVIKHYAFTEHTMVPDVLLMSARRWARIPPEHQNLIQQAAVESALLQTELWNLAEEESRFQAEAMGVQFHNPDKGPFMAKLAGLKDEYMRSPEIARLIGIVEGL